MTEHREDIEFEVGDMVRIVSEPYTDCPFEWLDVMDEYTGMLATIVSKRWGFSFETYAYEIDIDGRRYNWCKNCFLSPHDDEFEAASIEEIRGLYKEGVAS